MYGRKDAGVGGRGDTFSVSTLMGKRDEVSEGGGAREGGRMIAINPSRRAGLYD